MVLGTILYVIFIIFFALMAIISFLMGTLIILKTGKIEEWCIIGIGVGLSIFLFLYNFYQRFN